MAEATSQQQENKTTEIMKVNGRVKEYEFAIINAERLKFKLNNDEIILAWRQSAVDWHDNLPGDFDEHYQEYYIEAEGVKKWSKYDNKYVCELHSDSLMKIERDPIKSQKQSSNTNNAIITRADKLPALTNKELVKEKSVIVKKNGTYKVNGKEVPDSARVQYIINSLVNNKHNLYLFRIIDCDKNNEKAWCQAEVEDKKTGQIIGGKVVHHYETIRQGFILELIKNYMEALNKKKCTEADNPVIGIDEKTGEPILTSEANYKLALRLIKFKQFAERDATTKLARLLYLKIANYDWRDDDEIEFEDHEVDMVNTEIN